MPRPPTRVRSTSTSAAARPATDGASGGNSVESCDGAGWVRAGVSRTRRAIARAARTAATALNTNTKAMPPKLAAPNAAMAGPSNRPPIWAAPYSPNASPRLPGGVASVR